MAIWSSRGPACWSAATTSRRSRSRWLSESGSRERLPRDARAPRPLVAAAETVVPGHGGPITSDRALALLAEDRAYLEALPDAPLPDGRRTGEQKRIHGENLARL